MAIVAIPSTHFYTQSIVLRPMCSKTGIQVQGLLGRVDAMPRGPLHRSFGQLAGIGDQHISLLRVASTYVTTCGAAHT